uniref:ATP-dependent protease ATPase subunit HslU n=1 Tax=uncultured Alphaproteobacteria bacterium TaxID=91750 RepID=A0A6G8F2M4_9PROT|nr:ATP-dependent protease ATPase subunit HslU [uncultured Alphaproteobacteria bacterium]
MTSTNFSPKEIVSELDRYIIGQNEAKKAVAIALRNRWRRMQVDERLREEIVPKNILMVGPTGVGKTEISRRLAKLAKAPFIKVEATKFTEIGYVGRDVESIIRDLLDIAIAQNKTHMRKAVEEKAGLAAEERVLEALVGVSASDETKQKFRQMFRSGELDEREIEISVIDTQANTMPTMEIPGMPGAQMGMISLGDIFGKSFSDKYKTKKMTVADARKLVVQEECDKLLDDDKIIAAAVKSVENDGIVFIDEIDKISGRDDRRGGDVSREGVQRDLLPLIEGTTVSTKYGMVKTNHILFICSGAFHLSKPSDLLPELQGRLPIRVELQALAHNDFVRILTEPEANLIEQYKALLKTENFDLEFSPEAIDRIADISVQINENVENIGARRLHTVLEILLEDISFTASDRSGEKVVITPQLVDERLSKYTAVSDLSKFIL